MLYETYFVNSAMNSHQKLDVYYIMSVEFDSFPAI